jgi:hypothetical protein
MLIYTPMPMELILEGLDDSRDYRQVEVHGVTMIVEKISDHESKIVQIISTDPRVFLDSNLQPGTSISFAPQ